MSENQKTVIDFYTLIQKLVALTKNNGVLESIALIDEQTFLTLRESLIAAFQIDLDSSFDGEFGEEVEFGDMGDCVIGVTKALYPETTEASKPIDHEERVKWCKMILEEIDSAAKY